MKYKYAMILSGILLFTTLSMAGCGTQATGDTANPEQEVSAEQISQNEQEDKEMEDYYIFELNDNVTRTAVTYKNCYGITLSGDLYVSKDMDTSAKYPALIVGPPYGGVKE